MTGSARTPLLNPGVWPPGNSYVLPEHKIVYVSVLKAACTSLRWMMADLGGEDFQRFYRAPGNHQTRLMTIHTRRAIWQHVPQIRKVPSELRAQISRDDGWFIFSVIRDPWTRLWSAWQSKFLVRHGSYLALYGDEPWFPRIPQEGADILADWSAFVEARPWESHPELSTDRHFKAQVDAVHPDRVNYTRVYDLREMSTLLGDLRAHLAAVGKSKELYLPRANESPIAMTRDALGNGIAAAIEDAYRRDFAEFGDRWDLADVRLSDAAITADAVRAVVSQTVSNERIDDLSAELRPALKRLAEQRKQLAELRKQVAQLRKPAATTAPQPATTPQPLRRRASRLAHRAARRIRSAARRLSGSRRRTGNQPGPDTRGRTQPPLSASSAPVGASREFRVSSQPSGNDTAR